MTGRAEETRPSDIQSIMPVPRGTLGWRSRGMVWFAVVIALIVMIGNTLTTGNDDLTWS